jgi:hypothetical protein
LRGDGPHNLKHSLTIVVGAYGACTPIPAALMIGHHFSSAFLARLPALNWPQQARPAERDHLCLN